MGLVVRTDESSRLAPNYLAWNEMYRTAVDNQPSIPSSQQSSYRKSKSLNQVSSGSLCESLNQTPNKSNGKSTKKFHMPNSIRIPNSSLFEDKFSTRKKSSNDKSQSKEKTVDLIIPLSIMSKTPETSVVKTNVSPTAISSSLLSKTPETYLIKSNVSSTSIPPSHMSNTAEIVKTNISSNTLETEVPSIIKLGNSVPTPTHSSSPNISFDTSGNVPSVLTTAVTKSPRNPNSMSVLRTMSPKNKPSSATSRMAKAFADLEEKLSWTLNGRDFHLAIYVAMAHATLGALILLLYCIWMIMDEYRKPIQWALLCSMPLREVHKAMVHFWEKPLKEGLIQTVLAVPSALFKALIGTLMDARLGLNYLQVHISSKYKKDIGFSTFMQWLLSFALFTLGYEVLGPASLATITFVSMLLYAALTSLGIITPLSDHFEVEATWSILSGKKVGLEKSNNSNLLKTFQTIIHFLKLVNRRSTNIVLGSLHYATALFLITIMITGSFFSVILFSYKVGVEGKDAVVALNSHIQKSNYAERIGLKQWIEENKIPDLIEIYAGSAYGALSNQIDFFAAQHNLTDLVKEAKKYIGRVIRQKQINNHVSSLITPSFFFERLQSAGSKISEYDLRGMLDECEQAIMDILDHFHTSREDLVDKIRKWVDVAKKLASSSSTLAAVGLYVVMSIASSLASGAAEVMHFMTQVAVFFSVLYYLILSETGGVAKQVLSMVPLSESKRSRCANVLEDTVSNVLLSTAKAAFFEATFTWLLFRFFNIHFLYMSTLLALFGALLSLPAWFQLPSLLAGAELAVSGKYVPAVFLMVVHTGVTQLVVSRIYKNSLHNFTGISLAVGMLVFWHSPERAIMGPLLITILVAIRKLYLEFVFDLEKDLSRNERSHSSLKN